MGLTDIHAKVAAGGVWGALSILVIWGLGQAGYTIPPEVASSITTILSFVGGYLKGATP